MIIPTSIITCYSKKTMVAILLGKIGMLTHISFVILPPGALKQITAGGQCT